MLITMAATTRATTAGSTTTGATTTGSTAPRTTRHAATNALPAHATDPRDADDLREVFASVARYFSLLADPTRLSILHAICSDERSVSAIVEATGATQTNVSRHLGLMYRSGVVERRKEANQVFYRIADPAMMEICRTVCLQIAGQIDEREPLRKDLLKLAPQRRKAH